MPLTHLDFCDRASCDIASPNLHFYRNLFLSEPGFCVLPEYIRFSEIPSEHIIAQKGPFSVEQNVEHIRRSGAGILLTKESGAAGGYPEKAEAAKICGIRFITLTRPDEVGYTLSQIQEMLKKEVLEK